MSIAGSNNQGPQATTPGGLSTLRALFRDGKRFSWYRTYNSSMNPLDVAIAFGKEIGISVVLCPGRTWKQEFIPGLVIRRNSRILVDPNRIHDYGDVFHEMAHLALLPGCLRGLAYGDVESKSMIRRIQRIFDERNFDFGIKEDPLIRTLLQNGEPEAMAWAYAAQVHCGLPPKEQFVVYDDKDDDYRLATQQEIDDDLFALSKGMHLGVSGLYAGGMLKNKKDFPVLSRWVQP